MLEFDIQPRGRQKVPVRYPPERREGNPCQAWGTVQPYGQRSGEIRYVTPAQRPAGLDGEILRQRRRILSQVRPLGALVARRA